VKIFTSSLLSADLLPRACGLTLQGRGQEKAVGILPSSTSHPGHILSCQGRYAHSCTCVCMQTGACKYIQLDRDVLIHTYT